MLETQQEKQESNQAMDIMRQVLWFSEEQHQHTREILKTLLLLACPNGQENINITIIYES